jgi:hypothetical protein
MELTSHPLSQQNLYKHCLRYTIGGGHLAEDGAGLPGSVAGVLHLHPDTGLVNVRHIAGKQRTLLACIPMQQRTNNIFLSLL